MTRCEGKLYDCSRCKSGIWHESDRFILDDHKNYCLICVLDLANRRLANSMTPLSKGKQSIWKEWWIPASLVVMIGGFLLMVALTR